MCNFQIYELRVELAGFLCPKHGSAAGEVYNEWSLPYHVICENRMLRELAVTTDFLADFKIIGHKRPRFTAVKIKQTILYST